MKEDILCPDPEEDQEEAALAVALAAEEAEASEEVAVAALAADITAALEVRTDREDQEARDEEASVCGGDLAMAATVAALEAF